VLGGGSHFDDFGFDLAGFLPFRLEFRDALKDTPKDAGDLKPVSRLDIGLAHGGPKIQPAFEQAFELKKHWDDFSSCG
jgi:hypothetical protein